MSEEPRTPSKGITPSIAMNAAELVSYQDGSIVSRIIAKEPTGNITIFAFDEGEELSEHKAPFDALIQVLEGEARITVSGEPHRVVGGELILLPANQPHALEAKTRFKMILTMIRSERAGVRT